MTRNKVMKPESVICAIDVNDFDQEVVDMAAEFATHFSVELALLHITLFPDPGNAAWPAYLGSTNAVIQDNRLLQKIESTIEGVTVNRHHLSGIPTERILEFVERNEPRLLVMGTHGRRGLKRIFGSVASAFS